MIDKLDFTLTNYHSHTYRCMHADGTEEEFIRRAIKNGFKTFGFADHTPWPYRSDYVATMRMRLDQFDNYLSVLRDLRSKYKSKIDLKIGLECEAFPEYFEWLKELRSSSTVDYLILGNHFDTTDEGKDHLYFGYCSTPHQIERYVETTIAGMNTGLFSYLCHPDLFLNMYPEFDDTARSACHAICAEAEKLDLPLEFNILGYHRNPDSRRYFRIGYTSEEFWSIAAQYKVRCVIGIDAHHTKEIDCIDDYIKVRSKMSELGIRVIDQLDI